MVGLVKINLETFLLLHRASVVISHFKVFVFLSKRELSMECHGRAWSIMAEHGVSWPSMECHGRAWSIMAEHGVH